MKKLIRSKLIEVISVDEPDEIYITADGAEYEELLRDKLQEELIELLESDYKSIEEYADVMEVLYTMANYFGILSIEDIESERLKKLETKGNFIAGVVLNKR